MNRFIALLMGILSLSPAFAQKEIPPAQTRIMTLGVFHFAYPNLDAVQTAEEDQVSVLDEPYRSEIIAIAEAIGEFRPTIIAIEADLEQQGSIDSMYSLYREGKFTLKKGEIYQLGFRIAKKEELQGLYCVNDWGRHYPGIEGLFSDSLRLARLEEYYVNSPDSIYKIKSDSGKVNSIIDVLIEMNDPLRIKEDLSGYLLNPFKYEEVPGDFTGVDFETGRWFNRNLRIFRNLQRIDHTSDDRILLIIGSGHLNLLNYFIDVSREYELVSPVPFLENALLK